MKYRIREHDGSYYAQYRGLFFVWTDVCWGNGNQRATFGTVKEAEDYAKEIISFIKGDDVNYDPIIKQSHH